MTVITMPDGQAVDFGDMPPAQIKEIIRQKYPDRYPASDATAPPASAPVEEGSIFEPVMQGLTFGTFDELVGGIGGIDTWLQGRGFSEGYNRASEGTRQKGEAYAERHPYVFGAAEIGGALATLPVTGPLNLIRAPAAISRAAPIAARAGNALARGGVATANSALTGAAYGGAYGAGTAEGGLGPRLEGGLEGAKSGAVLGAAAPAVVGAVTKAGGALLGHPLRTYQHITKPGAAADRWLPTQSRRMRLWPACRSTRASPAWRPASRLDCRWQPLIWARRPGLARSAGNTSPEAHALLAEQTGERVATQYDRLSDFLSRPGIAPGTNAPEKLKLVQAAAERVNRARYKKAYSQGSFGIWNNDLANLTGSADVQKAIRDAIARSKSEAAMSGQGQVKMPFKEMPDGTLVPAPGVKPTLEFWDQVQRSLRDMGKRQSGERMAENAALYDRLRGRLNSILDREVPEFGNARLGAFKFFQAEDALEAGVKFANMTGDVLKSGAAKDAIQAMTPAERTLFAEGYASEFLNKAAKVPTDHNLVKRIFNNPTTKAQFELALGPQAAREMETRMHIEGIMQEGRQAVVGNSTTARQLIAQQTALIGGRALVGGAAGAIVSGDPLSPGSLFGAALMAGIGRRAGVVMTRADEQMMRRVAEMLSSDNPAMVKEAITRVTNNPRMMNAVRAGHEWVSRSLLPIAAGGVQSDSLPH